MRHHHNYGDAVQVAAPWFFYSVKAACHLSCSDGLWHQLKKAVPYSLPRMTMDHRIDSPAGKVSDVGVEAALQVDRAGQVATLDNDAMSHAHAVVILTMAGRLWVEIQITDFREITGWR